MKTNRKPRGIFSTNLKYKMEDYGITQADIVAATGAGTSNVSGWVTHNRNASPTNTRKVAKFLCVTEGWLTTEHSDVSANQLGSRILFKTKQLGLNIKALSEVVGVSQYYIKQWILGNKKPTYQQLSDLAIILEASTTWLEHGGAFDQQGNDTSNSQNNGEMDAKWFVDSVNELKAKNNKEQDIAKDSDPETTESSDDDTTDYGALFDQANKEALRRGRNEGGFGDSDTDTDETIHKAAESVDSDVAMDVPAQQEEADVLTTKAKKSYKNAKAEKLAAEKANDQAQSQDDNQDGGAVKPNKVKSKAKAKKRKKKQAKLAKQQQSFLEALLAQTTALTLPSKPTLIDYADIEVYAPANNTVVNKENQEVKLKGKQKLERTGEFFSIHREVFEQSGASPESSIGFYNTNLSMSPTIAKGAKCLADKSKTQIIDGEIYVFRYEKALGLAHLYHLPDGGLVIRSAAKDALEEYLSAEEAESLKVIGWVYSINTTRAWIE